MYREESPFRQRDEVWDWLWHWQYGNCRRQYYMDLILFINFHSFFQNFHYMLKRMYINIPGINAMQRNTIRLNVCAQQIKWHRISERYEANRQWEYKQQTISVVSLTQVPSIKNQEHSEHTYTYVCSLQEHVWLN